VLQGSSASADAGDPIVTLRHELAHLALHESMGDLPPRWFDEGYAGVAAHEWRREDALETNIGLAARGMPTLAQLDSEFQGGSSSAQVAYALAYRAVLDLEERGGERGLEPLFDNWRRTRSLDRAVRASYGITLSDFETKWRSSTRRRYGGLALVSNLAIGGLLMGLVILPLYLARRVRDRKRLEAMVFSEMMADAATASAVLSAILDDRGGRGGDSGNSGASGSDGQGGDGAGIDPSA
jgi:hypothetical protein